MRRGNCGIGVGNIWYAAGEPRGRKGRLEKYGEDLGGEGMGGGKTHPLKTRVCGAGGGVC